MYTAIFYVPATGRSLRKGFASTDDLVSFAEMVTSIGAIVLSVFQAKTGEEDRT